MRLLQIISVPGPRSCTRARAIFVKITVTMAYNIAVDSLVILASGGPIMLVMSIQQDKDGDDAVARCAWFDGFKLDGAMFAISDLVLAPSP